MVEKKGPRGGGLRRGQEDHLLEKRERGLRQTPSTLQFVFGLAWDQQA